MKIQTKKYQMPKKTYIRTGMINIVREQWWVSLIALGIASGTIFIPTTPWFIIGAVIGLILYALFWLIQFAGVTQLEQGKVLFERMSYEITSKEILMKISSKQGMPIKWEMIKRARMNNDHILLILSKAQFIYWPIKLFKTEHEVKFIETVLKRKGLIK